MRSPTLLNIPSPPVKLTEARRNVVNLSFEFFPPKSPAAEDNLWKAARCLGAMRPGFCSLTYGANGSMRSNSTSLLARLQRESGRPVAAHLTCVGASRGETDEIAREFHDAGVTHIVALRGDSAEGAPFTPHPDGYRNAAELVRGLRRIADFEISVAAYPEIHPDAVSSLADLDNLKRKLDGGATRCITQFFFDSDVFLRFVERARMHGIQAPIVPGILAPFNFNHVVRMARRCGTTVPAWLRHLFEGLDDQPDTRKYVAMNVAVELCRRLSEVGVRDFHFYTLNQSELSQAICHVLGFRAVERAA